MANSRARLAVFEALRTSVPSAFNEKLRHSFLTEGTNFDLADLDMDSLVVMEFCIAIEFATGVTLLPAQLAEFSSTDAIERHIREKLDEVDGWRRMNVGPAMGRVLLARPTRSTTNRLERAYRLYRRRISRCRTENQLNRVHVALDNYMTPLEVRYFRSALDGEAADSPSRRWIATVANSMPVNKVRSVEFDRNEIFRGVTFYTADAGSTDEKTLIIGFAGLNHRLMAPTSWLLDCLNPMLYDVIVLRDFSKRAFAFGIPGLGEDFFQTLSNLRMCVDARRYRNAISLGTSLGGIPALLAALLLKTNRGISIGVEDFRLFASRLKRMGLNDEPYAALLASRPRPFPELFLVHGAERKDDALAASFLNNLVPSRLWRVKNCAEHVVLKWYILRGTLPAFLAKILGQSLENHECLETCLSTTWAVASYSVSPSPRIGTAPVGGSTPALHAGS